ncbi:DUF1013 domain-containing protein [Tropicibacter alexandrii]|uniref:DUF1013 domain-containing protein n=1 Tax=Tropicibacter alexandrii TaxID=2267683 RepID=UPI000EF4C96C|nr:DUF1013 domain-containing protein [Tropicibacter alexandrii]
MAKLLHPKATAVWLVDNTTLTFKQIGDFTGFHELEIQGIADGDVAVGVKGFDPVANNQLEQADIDRAEKDPLARLKLKHNPAARDEDKRRGPRYTPLSKRQDRPNAILWLVKFHPELSDGQIAKLVGTTKPTIQSIRERTHWNIQNMQPIDPVALGLCKQSELDAAVAKAAKAAGTTMSDDERRKLVSTEQSLEMTDEPRLPSAIEGFENFSLTDPRGEEEEDEPDYSDPDSFFKSPAAEDEDDEDDQPR